MVDLLNYKKNSTSSSFVQTSIGRLLARKKGQCDTYQVLLKYYSMIKSTTLKKIGENKLSTFFSDTVFTYDISTSGSSGAVDRDRKMEEKKIKIAYNNTVVIWIRIE